MEQKSSLLVELPLEAEQNLPTRRKRSNQPYNHITIINSIQQQWSEVLQSNMVIISIKKKQRSSRTHDWIEMLYINM